MSNSGSISSNAASASISFGCILATVVSYCNWGSIGWAIFHGCLGWSYILYYIIAY